MGSSQLPADYFRLEDSGDYVVARKLLETEAEMSKNYDICFLLGQEYGVYSRKGLEDYNKAHYWFLRGAEMGDAACIYECGLALVEGLGIEKNVEAGVRKIQQAAALNNELAIEFLLKNENVIG